MRGILALSLFTLSSCAFAAPGERAQAVAMCNDPRECHPCPEGETCSPGAPQGLYFLGPVFADVPFGGLDVTPKAIAKGGLELIEIQTPPVDAWATPTGRPYPGSFRAESSSSALEVLTASGSAILVRGRSAGTAELRIVDGLGLLDRIALTVAEVEQVELRPVLVEDLRHPLADDVTGTVAWAALDGGGPLLLRARLLGAGRERLADQGLTTRSASVVLARGRSAPWDVLEFAPPTQSSLTVPLADGPSAPVPIDRVSGVDRIERAVVPGSDGVLLADDSPQTICFVAFSGERLVEGVAWSFSASFPITATAPERGCLTGFKSQPGTASVRVTAGATMRDVELEFE
jgi:hypothetical protein